MVAQNINSHLEEFDLIGHEQKGCRVKTRGTKDHLLLDKVILKDSKSRKANLTMAWIDYQKAYDFVPHSWIQKTLQMLGIADNTRNLLTQTMKTWQTVLQSEEKHLAKVSIRRGIFQGDSLSPLLFIMALIPMTLVLRDATPGYVLKSKAKINHLPYMDDLKLYGKTKSDIEGLISTVRIFSDDIGMRFGLQKCASIVLKRGKRVEDEGIHLAEDKMIEDVGIENYKYLGVLEADTIKMELTKEKIMKEYRRRVKKVLGSKLSGGNAIKAINAWAVSVVRYSDGVVDWTVNELKDADRKARKLLTLNGALHPRSNTDRLYLPRTEGGRGLISIEECVRQEERGLSDYVRNRAQEPVRGCLQHLVLEQTASEYKVRRKKEKEEEWRKKALQGQFVTRIEASEDTWGWLKTGKLKKETEGMILAAQDQALPTRHRKIRIEKQSGDPKCRLCGEREETVMHVLSECKKIAQTEYKKRHDKVATWTHWRLCQIYSLPHADSWYKHLAQKVIDTPQVKILWDFNIQTDGVLEARRLDIVVTDKENQETWIIDIAIPGDLRVREKELEKREKYQDLVIEMRRLWKTSVKIVPIVVGALGTIGSARSDLETLGINDSTEMIQTTALLGSAHILRKTLSL